MGVVIPDDLLVTYTFRIKAHNVPTSCVNAVLRGCILLSGGETALRVYPRVQESDQIIYANREIAIEVVNTS